MLCEKCGKRPATTYYQESIDGQVKTMHVCNECAQELGLGNFFTSFDFDSFFPAFSLFGGSVPKQVSSRQEPKCANCGAALSEIAKTGKMGCAECYQSFQKELMPTIEKIHGRVSHTGKVPKSAGADQWRKKKIEKYRMQLDACIKEQDFEKAAMLRDQIKSLEQGGGEQ